MSEYNFKKFTARGAKLGNYSISLTKSNSFGFSAAFCGKEGIRKYKKVIMFYDKEKKSVAFHFTNEENAEGAFTVINHKKGKTSSVTCRSFLIANEIDNKPEYFGSRIPKRINYDNLILYVVDLKKDESLDN